MVRVDILQEWIKGHEERQKLMEQMKVDLSLSGNLSQPLIYRGRWDPTRNYNHGDIIIKDNRTYVLDHNRFVEMANVEPELSVELRNFSFGSTDALLRNS
jgi:hypothetical protein